MASWAVFSAASTASAPQIAARFGISIAAAEKRLSRAKQRLGAALIRFDKRFDVAPGVAREGGTR